MRKQLLILATFALIINSGVALAQQETPQQFDKSGASSGTTKSKTQEHRKLRTSQIFEDRWSAQRETPDRLPTATVPQPPMLRMVNHPEWPQWRRHLYWNYFRNPLNRKFPRLRGLGVSEPQLHPHRPRACDTTARSATTSTTPERGFQRWCALKLGALLLPLFVSYARPARSFGISAVGNPAASSGPNSTSGLRSGVDALVCAAPRRLAGGRIFWATLKKSIFLPRFVMA